MKRLVLITIILFFIVMPTKSDAASSTWRISISGPNGYVLLASGGAFVYAFTTGCFSGRISHSANEPPNRDDAPLQLRLASLVTYDTKRETYKFEIPNISFEEDSFYVPLVKWRF